MKSKDNYRTILIFFKFRRLIIFIFSLNKLYVKVTKILLSETYLKNGLLQYPEDQVFLELFQSQKKKRERSLNWENMSRMNRPPLHISSDKM